MGDVTRSEQSVSSRTVSGDGLYEALIYADSMTSLVAHRHAAGLPADLREELLVCSAACRKLAEEVKPEPGLAVTVCYGGVR